jgi:hypothetical protein
MRLLCPQVVHILPLDNMFKVNGGVLGLSVIAISVSPNERSVFSYMVIDSYGLRPLDFDRQVRTAQI